MDLSLRSVMPICHLGDHKSECYTPDAEDRLMESFRAIDQLHEEYHDPQEFRYNLNAFLAAVCAVPALLQKEVEKAGQVQAWKILKQPLATDDALKAVVRGRNTTLHQRAIVDGSKVDIGLFRGRRHKLSMTAQIPHDVHSRILLDRWVNSQAGAMFIDPEHSAIGEQFGVWRRYYIPAISGTEDVLTVVRRAMARTHDLVALAHSSLFDIPVAPFDDDLGLDADSLAEVTVLLESDVDPSLLETWGWIH